MARHSSGRTRPRREDSRTLCRRLLLALALSLLALLPSAPSAVARAQSDPGRRASATTTTSAALPGTTLEADARTDTTSPAPWFIGSGLAAAAMVGLGGLWLKRRTD